MIVGRSLTQRMIWALTGTVAAFVVLLCSVAYFTFEQMEDELVNTVLRTEANQLLDEVDKGHEIPKQQSQNKLGSSLRVWHVEVAADKALLPGPLRSLDLGSYILSPSGNTWHVMVMTAPIGRLYVLYDATAHERRVVQFGLIVLALGAICILAAFAVAVWLARLVVGPMIELADRLSTWAPGAPDLTVRRKDEAGRLIEAFNRVQNRVEESLAFEREFASNLAHEIRTALAAIRSDAEMLLLDPATAQAARSRMQRMLAHVDAVKASLTSAERLANRGPLVHKQTNIQRCVNEAALALKLEADRHGLKVLNDIPHTYTEVLDPYALLMVARNLIRNAVEHATPATLTISQESEHSIAFADDGQGIPPDVLPLVFERYYSSSRSDLSPAHSGKEQAGARRGLGLAIAKQICNRHQWMLTVRSNNVGTERGTVFVLRFR